MTVFQSFCLWTVGWGLMEMYLTIHFKNRKTTRRAFAWLRTVAYDYLPFGKGLFTWSTYIQGLYDGTTVSLSSAAIVRLFGAPPKRQSHLQAGVIRDPFHFHVHARNACGGGGSWWQQARKLATIQHTAVHKRRFRGQKKLLESSDLAGRRVKLRGKKIGESGKIRSA